MVRWCVVLFTLVVLVSGCQKDSPNPLVPKNDNVVFDLTVEVNDPSRLTPVQQRVLKQINSRQPVNMRELGFQIIQHEHSRYREINSGEIPTAQSLVQSFTKLSQQISPTSDLWDSKVQYEKHIQTALKAPLKYNIDAKLTPFVFFEGRLNCYSGTNTTLLTYILSRPAQEVKDSHIVAIFEPGHVLSGRMVPTEHGFELVGVESTASGNGITRKGLAQYLDGQTLRVVAAEYYLVTEFFKSAGGTTEATAMKMLEATAKRYEIPLSKTEKNVEPFKNKKVSKADLLKGKVTVTGEIEKAAETAANFNEGTVFGFGVPDVKPGDQERAVISGDVRDLFARKKKQIIIFEQKPPQLCMHEFRSQIEHYFNERKERNSRNVEAAQIELFSRIYCYTEEQALSEFPELLAYLRESRGYSLGYIDVPLAFPKLGVTLSDSEYSNMPVPANTSFAELRFLSGFKPNATWRDGVGAVEFSAMLGKFELAKKLYMEAFTLEIDSSFARNSAAFPVYAAIYGDKKSEEFFLEHILEYNQGLAQRLLDRFYGRAKEEPFVR